MVVIRKSCIVRAIYAHLLTHIVEKSAFGRVYCFVRNFLTLLSHCPLGEVPSSFTWTV